MSASTAHAPAITQRVTIHNFFVVVVVVAVAAAAAAAAAIFHGRRRHEHLHAQFICCCHGDYYYHCAYEVLDSMLREPSPVAAYDVPTTRVGRHRGVRR